MMLEAVKQRIIDLYNPSVDESDGERRRKLLDILIFFVSAVVFLSFILLLLSVLFFQAGPHIDFFFVSGIIFSVLLFSIVTYLLNHYASSYLASFVLLILFTVVILISDEARYVVQGRNLIYFSLPISCEPIHMLRTT